MAKHLTGRKAIVTGGGGGIGAAAAEALAGAGASVTVAGRRMAPLRQVADRTGGQAVACDVTDPDSVAGLFDRAGPVEIVVACAGRARSGPWHAWDPESWRDELAVNLTGAFLTARHALSGMKSLGAGRLIFVASTAGLKGYRYVAPYVAAKHGVVGLTKALALEVARQDVTVNAVCPGFADTPMLTESIDAIAAATGRSAQEARAALVSLNPQDRLIQPAEVAACVVWLCSDQARSVTGQAIAISGGEI